MQRLLWARKNPSYPDLLYVEPLTAPTTINTMAEETIGALLRHGKILAHAVEHGIPDARRLLDDLDRLGVRSADVAARLEQEGVRKFAEAFDRSITQVKEACGATDMLLPFDPECGAIIATRRRTKHWRQPHTTEQKR